MEILIGILSECWEIFVEAAPYVLFGFFAAGLLKALIPDDLVARHLGKSSTGSVLKASLLGVPLPLCSCGVIPAAISLRKQGASKGASAAFLVSTPESGVDSIAITYALLDPLMAVIRPLAALFTATVTGLLINRLPEDETVDLQGPASGCGCEGEGGQAEAKPPLRVRLKEGLSYAFGELLKDIGGWLLIGIGIAGVIGYLVPEDFFALYLGSEFVSLLVMLVVGIPLYICASASTPIAAALVLKGISPGAALVFLLAGPATNAATITVVARFWGRRVMVVYLATIAVCSLLLGYLVNRIYAWAEIDITDWVGQAEKATESPFFLLSAFLLAAILLRNYLPRRKGAGGCGCDEKPGGG